MGIGTNPRWGAVERGSPTLFLVGGGLMVGHAAFLAVQAFTNLSTPPDVFGPAGHLVAIVGLFGLYPTLADRTPLVARGAAAVAAVAVTGWAVMTGTRFLVVAGVVAAVGDVLPGAVVLLLFVSTIVTYVLFGVATVRVDDSPRVVSLLLLAPAALIGGAIVAAVFVGVTAGVGVVIGSGLALSMLGLGATLRTWDRLTGHAAPAGDVTLG